MASPSERFERWRQRQSVRTAKLGMRVLEELVPLFEDGGFRQFDDYAGNDLLVVGANTIALQRRSGDRWPTVEIRFHQKGRPSFNITFSELPEACYRWTSGSPVAMDRGLANVVEGNIYFSLCKGLKEDFDCTFGVATYSLFQDRLIARDFELAKNRAVFLLKLFDSGIPERWADASPGYVSEFVFKNRQMKASSGVAKS